MNIVEVIQDKVVSGVKELYEAEVSTQQAPITPTRKEFKGNYTVVVFPFTRIAKKKPETGG